MITPAEVTDEDLEACLFTPDDYLARERVAACWNRLLSKHRVISAEDVEKLKAGISLLQTRTYLEAMETDDRVDWDALNAELSLILSRLERGTK